MPMLPPASATLVWVLTTPHEDIRCLAWKHGRGWMIGIYFGGEALDLELAPSREAMEIWGDEVRRKLMALGFGKGGPLGGREPPSSAEPSIVLPPWVRRTAGPKDLTETDEDF